LGAQSRKVRKNSELSESGLIIAMRLLFFVVGLVFLSVPSAVGSTDFSGTWALI